MAAVPRARGHARRGGAGAARPSQTLPGERTTRQEHHEACCNLFWNVCTSEELTVHTAAGTSACFFIPASFVPIIEVCDGMQSIDAEAPGHGDYWRALCGLMQQQINAEVAGRTRRPRRRAARRSRCRWRGAVHRAAGTRGRGGDGGGGVAGQRGGAGRAAGVRGGGARGAPLPRPRLLGCDTAQVRHHESRVTVCTFSTFWALRLYAFVIDPLSVCKHACCG